MAVAKLNARPGGRTARVTQKVEQVTAQILVERGYSGLTFKEVAQVAGVSRSTLYRKWPNRAAMALDAVRQIVRTRVVFKDTGSFEGDLRAILQRIATFIVSPEGQAVLLATIDMQQSGEALYDDGLSWSERVEDVMPLFERAVERGELASDVDAEVVFAMVAGTLYFRLIVMRQQPDKAWIERVLKRVSSILS
jgi:AcrR family transcriptional regulator